MSMCREQVSGGCSALDGTTISHLLTSKAHEYCWTRGNRSIRARGLGRLLQKYVVLDTQRCCTYKITTATVFKPLNIQAWIWTKLTKVPLLAGELLVVDGFWKKQWFSLMMHMIDWSHFRGLLHTHVTLGDTCSVVKKEHDIKIESRHVGIGKELEPWDGGWIWSQYIAHM